MAKKRIQFKIYDTMANLALNNANATLLRKVSWYGDNPKVDIRKWFNYNTSNEIPGHGVSLSLEAVDILTESLVKFGYGRKEELEKLLDVRQEIDREVPDEEDETDIKEQSSKKVKESKDFYSAKDLLALEYEE